MNNYKHQKPTGQHSPEYRQAKINAVYSKNLAAGFINLLLNILRG